MKSHGNEQGNTVTRNETAHSELPPAEGRRRVLPLEKGGYIYRERENEKETWRERERERNEFRDGLTSMEGRDVYIQPGKISYRLTGRERERDNEGTKEKDFILD